MAMDENDDDKLGRGRPSAYNSTYAEQAKKLCELGATDMELADFFNVDVRTIYNWKHQHEDFFQALVVGKDALDNRVERSLYQRAVGYSFNSEKIFSYQGEIVRTETVEHVPPETGAAMSWLKNRRGDVWRDKSEIAHNVTMSETAAKWLGQ
jgi:hypothetical protein